METTDLKSSDRRTVLLGRKVMDEVSKVVPVLPVPLVATVMRSAKSPMKEAEIQDLCTDLLVKLKCSGARVHALVHQNISILQAGQYINLEFQPLSSVISQISSP